MDNLYECKIILHNIPSSTEQGVCMELYDVINNLEILPYDFEIITKKCGEIL